MDGSVVGAGAGEFHNGWGKNNGSRPCLVDMCVCPSVSSEGATACVAYCGRCNSLLPCLSVCQDNDTKTTTITTTIIATTLTTIATRS